MNVLFHKIFLVCTVLAIWIACGSSDAVVTVDGRPDTLRIVFIDIGSRTVARLSDLTIQVGDTVRLSATAFNALDQVVSGAPITWRSSSPGVASINAEGTAVGLSPGFTRLSASTDNVTAEIPTTVEPSQDPSDPSQGALDVSPAFVTLTTLGATAQLSVSAVDSLGQTITPPITWQSRSPSVATVNSSGRVTAQSFGTAVITAASSCCTVDSSVVTVQQGPSGSSSLDWFCDWDAGTGDSFAILQGRGGFGECFDEFTASARDTFMIILPKDPAHGFPAAMTNVMRIVHDRNMSGSMMVQIDSGWAPPRVGEHLFIRTYDFNDAEVGSQFNNHWLHIGNNNEGASDYQGIWRAQGRVASDSTYDNRWGVGVASNPSSSGRGQGYFNNNSMKAGRLYRREVRMTRTDPDSVRVRIRIYDDVGNLVLTGADFRCATGGCASAGGFAADTVGQYKAQYRGANGFHSLEVGNNGAESGDPATPQFWYVGGFAFRVSADPNDWIGPYPVTGSGEGN